MKRRSLKFGLALVACAVVWRALSMGALEPVKALLSQPGAASFLLYLQTGHIYRERLETAPPSVPTEQPETVPPATEGPEERGWFFEPEDASLVRVSDKCGYGADVPALLLSELKWDLTQGGPAVLIVHTHGTECYTPGPGEEFTQSSPYRTLDDGYNLVSIGDEVARLLEAGGVETIHDRTPHDSPSYNDAYNQSRMSVEEYLERYPSIRMVLDLHRDAASTPSGQLRTLAQVDGEDSAQLMMVVGTDASGLDHPNWPENMALAIKLTALLEKTHPGLTRPISFRSQRFNQDLSPGAMLIEVGAAGNTHAEALRAARALAKGILALAGGTATADSTS